MPSCDVFNHQSYGTISTTSPQPLSRLFGDATDVSSVHAAHSVDDTVGTEISFLINADKLALVAF